MSKQSQIIEVIEALAESVPNGILTKKPNVKDIEQLLGSDIDASERDEAWAAYADAQDKPEPVKASLSKSVTNNHGSVLSIQGVTIRRGETAEIKGFDASNYVMKRWIGAGVISVKGVSNG